MESKPFPCDLKVCLYLDPFTASGVLILWDSLPNRSALKTMIWEGAPVPRESGPIINWCDVYFARSAIYVQGYRKIGMSNFGVSPSVRPDYNHFSPPSIGHCWKCLRTFSVRVFWSKEIWSSEKDCSKLALAIHNGHFGDPVLDTFFEHFWDFCKKSEICLLGWLLGDPWRQVTWVWWF